MGTISGFWGPVLGQIRTFSSTQHKDNRLDILNFLTPLVFLFKRVILTAKPLNLTVWIGSKRILPEGQTGDVPSPSRSDQSGSSHCIQPTALYSSAPSPQVCCCLFLNSCYSRAGACAWNTKHAESSSFPSISVRNSSPRQASPVHRTVHT